MKRGVEHDIVHGWMVKVRYFFSAVCRVWGGCDLVAQQKLGRLMGLCLYLFFSHPFCLPEGTEA